MNGDDSIRAAVAQWWVRVLYWHTSHAPIVPRMFKPFITAVTWRTSRRVRETTLANAARIMGPDSTASERTRMGRAVLSSFFDWVVAFAGSGRGRADVEHRLESIEGLDEYLRARAVKRGAILATAHLGPFESAVAVLATREPRIHVVFRRDEHAGFERLRARQRRRMGVIEAAVDDGLGVWFRLRDALAGDEVVLVQADRVLAGQPGVRVPFLGGHIRVPTGPVKLARITGAPLIPVFAIGGPKRKIRIIFAEVIPVDPSPPPPGTLDPAVLRLTAAIERVVRAHPEQWLRFDKAWCEDQEPAPDGRSPPHEHSRI